MNANIKTQDSYVMQMVANDAGVGSSKKKLSTWDVEEVSNWMVDSGFEDIAQVFVAHGINGATLPAINDLYLKEMGIQSLGRRTNVYAAILKMKAIERAEWRQEMVWEDEEYRNCCPGCCIVRLPPCFPCFCHSVNGYPDQYRMTNAKLTKIKKKQNRCVCLCLDGIFCGHNMSSETVDISDIKDVTVLHSDSNSPCSRSAVAEVVVGVGYEGHQLTMTVDPRQAQRVSTILMNAKEEAVVNEVLQIIQ